MKCPNCGNELEPGKIYCDHCGHEIQIVPDYDPLDELLIGREEPEEPGIGTTPNPGNARGEWREEAVSGKEETDGTAFSL